MKSWLLTTSLLNISLYLSNLPKPHLLSPPRQSLTLPELPAVVVFKDGGYFTYDGELFPLLVFQFVNGKNLKISRRAAGWRLFIDSPAPLPRGVPFFIAVRRFSRRRRSSPLIFPTTLELWRAGPNTNHPGRCPLLCVR